jgi:hypothetical protein
MIQLSSPEVLPTLAGGNTMRALLFTNHAKPYPPLFIH